MDNVIGRYLSWRKGNSYDERTHTNWRFGMAAFSVLWGGGYAIGPASFYSSPAFDFVKAFWLPIPVYGFAMVGFGIGMFTPWFRDVAFASFLFWNFWTFCLFGAWFTAPITAWGAAPLGLVVTAVMGRLSRTPDEDDLGDTGPAPPSLQTES